MSANDYSCDGCGHFKWIPEMGAHLPWCRLDGKFDPVKCDRFETSRLYRIYLETVGGRHAD